MTADTETYYLSAESHNRWRGNVPYREFPMRVCVSIQFISAAGQIRDVSSFCDEGASGHLTDDGTHPEVKQAIG
jgi:hypothetical protein